MRGLDSEPAWKAWGCKSCLICVNLSLPVLSSFLLSLLFFLLGLTGPYWSLLVLTGPFLLVLTSWSLLTGPYLLVLIYWFFTYWSSLTGPDLLVLTYWIVTWDCKIARLCKCVMLLLNWNYYSLEFFENIFLYSIFHKNGPYISWYMVLDHFRAGWNFRKTWQSWHDIFIDNVQMFIPAVKNAPFYVLKKKQ